MHARPLILAGAISCALLHVTGVLFGRPVWRWAEVLTVLLLLAYALLGEPRVARWALPAALGVLLMVAGLTRARVSWPPRPARSAPSAPRP